jgi:hypothetical protein
MALPQRSSSRGRSVAFAPEVGADPEAASPAALWGPEAVRALRQPRALADAVPGEAALLAAVRARVGPYASEGALRHHVRNTHAKTEWAVNSYLREAVLARVDDGPADFEPAAHRPAARGEAQQEAEERDGAPQTAAPPQLPPALWELVLRLLDAPDVRSAGAVCVALRAAAASQALWRALYARRWGPRAFAACLPGRCWRAAYGERAEQLGAMRCPLCAAPRALTAVIYGFPATALVAAQRAGVVLLGGDYIFPTSPSWACAACGLQWTAWPWAAGGGSDPAPLAARVPAAGAGAGVHFAAEV